MLCYYYYWIRHIIISIAPSSITHVFLCFVHLYKYYCLFWDLNLDHLILPQKLYCIAYRLQTYKTKESQLRRSYPKSPSWGVGWAGAVAVSSVSMFLKNIRPFLCNASDVVPQQTHVTNLNRSIWGYFWTTLIQERERHCVMKNTTSVPLHLASRSRYTGSSGAPGAHPSYWVCEGLTCLEGH